MQKRNPIAVAAFALLTFGIYGIYWEVKTKGEMNNLGAQIPTAWLIIVPFVNIWWMWKYCEGVDHVTNGKYSTVLSFLLLWLTGMIGMAILQDGFNNHTSATPQAPAAPAMPGPQAPQM
jgi:hypothetical protein